MPNRNVNDVLAAIEELRAQGGDIMLRLEKPKFQSRMIQEEKDGPRRIIIDESAPKITHLRLEGFSTYSGRNAGGGYRHVVALTDGGYVLHGLAITTPTAAELAAGHQPELIISDMHMHEMVTCKMKGKFRVSFREGVADHPNLSRTEWFD